MTDFLLCSHLCSHKRRINKGNFIAFAKTTKVRISFSVTSHELAGVTRLSVGPAAGGVPYPPVCGPRGGGVADPPVSGQGRGRSRPTCQWAGRSMRRCETCRLRSAGRSRLPARSPSWGASRGSDSYPGRTGPSRCYPMRTPHYLRRTPQFVFLLNQ